jgi:hypothetical protein
VGHRSENIRAVCQQCASDVDLATGPESTNVGPYNLRFKDQEGGTLKIGTNDLFTEPWNSVAGSNWIWDGFVSSYDHTGQFQYHRRRGFDG